MNVNVIITPAVYHIISWYTPGIYTAVAALRVTHSAQLSSVWFSTHRHMQYAQRPCRFFILCRGEIQLQWTHLFTFPFMGNVGNVRPMHRVRFEVEYRPIGSIARSGDAPDRAILNFETYAMHRSHVPYISHEGKSEQVSPLQLYLSATQDEKSARTLGVLHMPMGGKPN